LIFGLGAFATDLTFRVDMSKQTVSPDGVHLVGSFQDWNPAATEMTNMGNDVFAVTISIAEDENIQYKFINGIDWPKVELVPQACGIDDGYDGYNRYLTVPQEDSTLMTVCFGSCSPCGYIVGPLITSDNWQSHQWPYNAYYPLCSNPNHNHGIVNGHVACSCGPIAVSRLLHYWEFPVQGNGSFSFTDVYGCTYSADFGSTIYEWDKMPYVLNENDPEDVYAATATLTYHVATCVNDVIVNGANVEMWITGLTTYFGYSSTAEQVIRSNYTKEEWISIYKAEIDNGRPILIAGGNPSGGGHWFICDGYNEADQFHFIMSWGGSGDDYYDIDNPNGYSLNNKALIGLQPELNGKEIALESLNEGGVLQAGEEIQITWFSENISDIKIDYTLDNGYNWQVITESTSASTGFFTWTVPNATSDQCKVKITDATDINIYDKSNDVFSISLYELELTYPNGGDFFIAGDLTQITWANTPVTNIKIEFSDDNGSNWTEISANFPASAGSIAWTVPDITSNQCLIKITDVADATIFDISENTFEIGEANTIGGPYISDANTVLLLHFDNNLSEASHSYPVSNHGIAKTYIANPVTGLNDAIHFDNSVQGNQSFITVPNSAGEMSLSGNWTIEFWLYIESWNQDHNNWPVPIVLPTTGWDANYGLEIPASWERLKYGFTTNNGGVTLMSSSNSITTGTWYHVALINDYNNYTSKLLLHDSDFQILDEQSMNYVAGTISIGTQNLLIGAGLAGDNYLNGYIDELRISNVVRDFTGETQTNSLTVKKVTSEVALDGLLEESFWDISSLITLGSSIITANFGVVWVYNYLYV
jgi:hypothetical protein